MAVRSAERVVVARRLDRGYPFGMSYTLRETTETGPDGGRLYLLRLDHAPEAIVLEVSPGGLGVRVTARVGGRKVAMIVETTGLESAVAAVVGGVA